MRRVLEIRARWVARTAMPDRMAASLPSDANPDASSLALPTGASAASPVAARGIGAAGLQAPNQETAVVEAVGFRRAYYSVAVNDGEMSRKFFWLIKRDHDIPVVAHDARR